MATAQPSDLYRALELGIIMAIRIERLKPIASQMLYSTGAMSSILLKPLSLLCSVIPTRRDQAIGRPYRAATQMGQGQVQRKANAFRAALCISHNNSYEIYILFNINRLAKFRAYAENCVIIFRAKLLILLNLRFGCRCQMSALISCPPERNTGSRDERRATGKAIES